MLGAELLKDRLQSPGEGVLNDTPGMLLRDLSRAFQQAGSLATPALPPIADAAVANDNMAMPPPPPVGQAGLSKARKRKLEADLGIGGGGAGLEDLGIAVDGADGDERLMLRELLDGDSLGLPGLGGAKPPKRSKPKPKEKGKPTVCRCDRSGCLKRYCVCFAEGRMCVPGTCKCKGCENDDTTAERKEKRDKAVTEMAKKKSNAFQSRFGGEGEEKAHLTGCNCKRSGCQRRYCECYQSGAKCTEKCKCCECKNPHGTNPHYRPIPPETVKGLPTSPGGTPLVIDGVEGGTAPVQVVNSPGGGGEPSPKHLVVPLQAPNKQQVPAASVPSTIQPPSPTAFVKGLLAACNAAATEDASRKASRPGVWNAPAGTDKAAAAVAARSSRRASPPRLATTSPTLRWRACGRRPPSVALDLAARSHLPIRAADTPGRAICGHARDARTCSRPPRSARARSPRRARTRCLLYRC